jgi:hypothetical protein
LPEEFAGDTCGGIIFRDASSARFMIALSEWCNVDYLIAALDDAVSTTLNGPGRTLLAGHGTQLTTANRSPTST